MQVPASTSREETGKRHAHWPVERRPQSALVNRVAKQFEKTFACTATLTFAVVRSFAKAGVSIWSSARLVCALRSGGRPCLGEDTGPDPKPECAHLCTLSDVIGHACKSARAANPLIGQQHRGQHHAGNGRVHPPWPRPTRLLLVWGG